MTFIHDGPPARAVIVGQGRNNGSHALIRAEVETPFLPLDHVSLYLETGAQRLIDPDRTAHIAYGADRDRIVFRQGFRQRRDTFIHDPDDLLCIHIDDCCKAGNLAGPSVAHAALVRTLDMGDALAALLLSAKVSWRLSGTADEGEIGDAALLHRGDEVRVL